MLEPELNGEIECWSFRSTRQTSAVTSSMSRRRGGDGLHVHLTKRKRSSRIFYVAHHRHLLIVLGSQSTAVRQHRTDSPNDSGSFISHHKKKPRLLSIFQASLWTLSTGTLTNTLSRCPCLSLFLPLGLLPCMKRSWISWSLMLPNGRHADNLSVGAEAKVLWSLRIGIT